MDSSTGARLGHLPSIDSDLGMEDVLSIISEAITAKKGEDIVILDLTQTVDYLDYLVICCGQTEIHNRAIADNIEDQLSRYDIIPDGLHGHRHGGWILLDYGVLVVHVFLPGLRSFYRLEELWAAGSEVELK